MKNKITCCSKIAKVVIFQSKHKFIYSPTIINIYFNVQFYRFCTDFYMYRLLINNTQTHKCMHFFFFGDLGILPK